MDIKQILECFTNFIGDNELGEKEGQTTPDITLEEKEKIEESKIVSINKTFTKFIEQKINEVDQETAEEVNDQRQADVNTAAKDVEKAKQELEDAKEVLKIANEKAKKSNKLLKKWKKSKGYSESIEPKKYIVQDVDLNSVDPIPDSQDEFDSLEDAMNQLKKRHAEEPDKYIELVDTEDDSIVASTDEIEDGTLTESTTVIDNDKEFKVPDEAYDIVRKNLLDVMRGYGWVDLEQLQEYIKDEGLELTDEELIAVAKTCLKYTKVYDASELQDTDLQDIEDAYGTVIVVGDFKRLPKNESLNEEVVAKFDNGKHEIVKCKEGYFNRYNIKNGKARTTTKCLESLPSALMALKKRFPKAEEVKE